MPSVPTGEGPNEPRSQTSTRDGVMEPVGQGRIRYGILAPNGPNLIAPEVFRGAGQETIERLRSLDVEKRFHPDVILVASPHWHSRGPFLVQASPKPEFIEDFSGFPRQLYGHDYRPPGDPEFATLLAEEGRRAGLDVRTSTEWGLDHGAWTPLRYLAPSATVPVVALSISSASREDHIAWGRAVARAVERSGKRAVLVATGIILHNFDRLSFSADAPPWTEGAPIEREILDLVLRGKAEEVARFDPEKWREAEPEGDFRPYFILAGSLGDAFTPRVLGNERIFGGAGMTIVEFARKEDRTLRREIDEWAAEPPMHGGD